MSLRILLIAFLVHRLALAGEPPISPGLRIEALAGDGGVNSVTAKNNVVPPVVRVRTAAGAPAVGIPVRFELVGNPELGCFAGRQSVLETTTNARGEATAAGYIPMRTGSFTMNITALGTEGLASLQIHQRNGMQPYSISRQRRRSRTIWAIAGAGAAGAVLAAVLVSRGSSSPASISLGGPTVGGPR